MRKSISGKALKANKRTDMIIKIAHNSYIFISFRSRRLTCTSSHVNVIFVTCLNDDDDDDVDDTYILSYALNDTKNVHTTHCIQ